MLPLPLQNWCRSACCQSLFSTRCGEATPHCHEVSFVNLFLGFRLSTLQIASSGHGPFLRRRNVLHWTFVCEDSRGITNKQACTRASSQARRQAGRQASKHARMHACTQARRPASKQAGGQQAGKQASTQVRKHPRTYACTHARKRSCIGPALALQKDSARGSEEVDILPVNQPGKL